MHSQRRTQTKRTTQCTSQHVEQRRATTRKRLWVPGERSGGGGGEETRGRAASMAAIANLTYTTTTTTTTTSSYSLWWWSSSSVAESGNRYGDGGTVGWFQQQVLVSRSLRVTYCASASLTRATECEKRFWRARKSSARRGGGGQRFLEQGEGSGWQGALLFVTTPKKLLACGCEGEKWRRRRRQSVLNCCSDKASENAAVQVRLEILAVYLYAIQHISRVFSFFSKAIVLGRVSSSSSSSWSF